VATVRSYGGNLGLTLLAQYLASVDGAGGEAINLRKSLTFAAAGGDAPTLSGWVYASEITAAAGDWLIAHASDPFQGMGDAAYSPGFAPAGAKVKLLYILADGDNTETITIARGATNGFPLFDAANDSVTLAAGDFLLRYWQAGSAALTTTSNDKLTVSVSGAGPLLSVLILYGP
jgi:hypothetical protein